MQWKAVNTKFVYFKVEAICLYKECQIASRHIFTRGNMAGENMTWNRISRDKLSPGDWQGQGTGANTVNSDYDFFG